MKMLVSRTWSYLLVATLGVAIFVIGRHHGENLVQVKWDAQDKKDRQAYDILKNEYDILNRNHSYEVGQLTQRLQIAQAGYEAELNRIGTDYSNRLQQSTKRAEIYKRQSESGTIECRSLASHAAKLDGSLEQGRQLVEELRATVRLRDGQLIELGNQIQADRKLFK